MEARIKALVIDALCAGEFKVAKFRWRKIKYVERDEDEHVVIRLDKNRHEGLCVGDERILVDPGILGGNRTRTYESFKGEHTVLAFVQMTQKMGGVEIKEMFCITGYQSTNNMLVNCDDIGRPYIFPVDLLVKDPKKCE